MMLFYRLLILPYCPNLDKEGAAFRIEFCSVVMTARDEHRASGTSCSTCISEDEANM